MSFGAKLARGVLMGLSGYYGEQAKLQAEERKLAILADRESARASVRRSASDAASAEPDAADERHPAESYEQFGTSNLGWGKRQAKLRGSRGTSISRGF